MKFLDDGHRPKKTCLSIPNEAANGSFTFGQASEIFLPAKIFPQFNSSVPASKSPKISFFLVIKRQQKLWLLKNRFCLFL